MCVLVLCVMKLVYMTEKLISSSESIDLTSVLVSVCVWVCVHVGVYMGVYSQNISLL